MLISGSNMGEQPPTSQPGFSERIPELDGLRGIAIALVLYFHCFSQVIKEPLRPLLYPLILPGRSGWTGVDLFFVLSGFLIGGILLDAKGSTNYFRVFYTRRFFRIVPAYVVLLVAYYVICAIASFRNLPQLQWKGAWDVPWYVTLLFLQNFWVAITNKWHPLVLSILWSLSVEEQFYLTLPWLVKFFDRKRMFQIAIEGILLAICFRLLMLKFSPGSLTTWYVLMPSRADALLLGFLGALVWRNADWRARIAAKKNLHRALLLVFAAGFPFLTWKYDEPFGTWLASIGLTSIAFFYFLVLLYGLIHKEGIVGWFLRRKWLGWLGGIAYGVYLFHRLFMATFAGLVWHWSGDVRITTPLQLLLQFLMVASLLAFCKLLFVFYEKPLLKQGHKVSYEFRNLSDSVSAKAEEAIAGTH